MELTDNMIFYGQISAVPDYAKKEISAGRLRGFTDINAMWRIESLTKLFGPCGIGWWYEIVSQRLEPGTGGEVKAFVDINLYYKWGDEVSKPIPGIGGSSFIAQEKKGLYTSDECFKMALTDAISVAAKALGMGADVYMGCDRDKYNTAPDDPPPPQNYAQQHTPPQQPPQQRPQQAQQQAPQIQLPPTGPDGYWYCADCGNVVSNRKKTDGTVMLPKDIVLMSMQAYGQVVCADCGIKRRKAQKTA